LMPLGDPHPFAWIRVLFNVELCRSWYGSGPWDDLAATWIRRHPLDLAPPGARLVAEASLPRIKRLAEVCTRRPMRAFGGRALYQLADPRHVSPTELAQLAKRAGESLYTSSFLQRHESLRILAWNTFQVAVTPENAPALAAQLERWLQATGAAETSLLAA
jgi:hypothetical protein